MIIRKKKLKELLTKCIIETGRQCGRNLGLKDISKIKNSLKLK